MSASTGRPRREDQSGVALVSTLLAILLLTIVVAALALAAMGETGMAFEQSRSARAIHLAEAGVFRGLAELRRRLALDLNDNVVTADPLTVRGFCMTNQGWRIITTYGGPGWTDEVANRRAVLAVGRPSSPVEVRDPGGAAIGSFYAAIYIRPADNGGPPGANTCGVDADTGIESYRMPFDYFITATGVFRNARRTVCLKNPGNLADCGAWLLSANPGSTTWDSAPSAHAWDVLIEAAFSPPLNRFTAPRYPRLNPDPLYDRSLWEELTGQ